ncbi:MAG TPA: nucleotide-binding protein [Methanomicrobiales archaeon]|nr:nucleotide-binding protein [Methanomicrobiales archaeon]
MRLLLDTNAFLLPVQFGVDLVRELEGLFGACELLTLEGVVRELQGIGTGRGKDAAAARVGLGLARRCTVLPSPTPAGDVDGDMVRVAEESGCIVVTNDRVVRNSLLGKGLGVVSLRGRKRLEFIRG